MDYLLVTFSPDTALSTDGLRRDYLIIGSSERDAITYCAGGDIDENLAGKTIRIEGNTLRIWFGCQCATNDEYGFRVTAIEHCAYSKLKSVVCSDASLVDNYFTYDYLRWDVATLDGFMPMRYTWAVELDGVEIGRYTTDDPYFEHTPGANGSYSVRVRVTDARGNTADASSGSYKVENAALDYTMLFTYEALDDGGIRISKFLNEEIDVICVPSHIAGKPVKEIGAYAFYDMDWYCKSVLLPEGVERICEYAFRHSRQESISLPQTLVEIGDYAFFNSHGLRSITLPSRITTVAESAFGDCYKLESVRLTGVESIGKNAFQRCVQLKEVHLPDTLKTIGQSAFAQCDTLTELDIPDSVITIEQSAFSKCAALKTLKLSGSLASIGQSAFEECAALTALDMPDTVTEIEAYAFKGCAALAALDMSDGLKSIKKRMFEGCDNLAEVVLPSRLTFISSGLFSGCTKLKKVNIPEGVTGIGTDAFFGCSSLEELRLPDSISFISPYAFSKARIGTLYYPTNYTNFVIKETYYDDPDGYYDSGWNEMVRETSPFEGSSVIIDNLIIPEGPPCCQSMPSLVWTFPASAFHRPSK